MATAPATSPGVHATRTRAGDTRAASAVRIAALSRVAATAAAGCAAARARRGPGRDQDALVVDRDHGVDGCRVVEGDHGGDAGVDVVEGDDDGAVVHARRRWPGAAPTPTTTSAPSARAAATKSGAR